MKLYCECPSCGASMEDRSTYDEIEHYWYCDRCDICCDDDGNEIEEPSDMDSLYSDENGVPVSCQACGGPYPNCRDGSCPVFDD